MFNKNNVARFVSAEMSYRGGRGGQGGWAGGAHRAPQQQHSFQAEPARLPANPLLQIDGECQSSYLHAAASAYVDSGLKSVGAAASQPPAPVGKGDRSAGGSSSATISAQRALALAPAVTKAREIASTLLSVDGTASANQTALPATPLAAVARALSHANTPVVLPSDRCTYTSTSTRSTVQLLATCHTCAIPIICVVCAGTCHAQHYVTLSGEQEKAGYCHCGTDGACQGVDSSGRAAQTLSENEQTKQLVAAIAQYYLVAAWDDSLAKWLNSSSDEWGYIVLNYVFSTLANRSGGTVRQCPPTHLIVRYVCEGPFFRFAKIGASRVQIMMRHPRVPQVLALIAKHIPHLEAGQQPQYHQGAAHAASSLIARTLLDASNGHYLGHLLLDGVFQPWVLQLIRVIQPYLLDGGEVMGKNELKMGDEFGFLRRYIGGSSGAPAAAGAAAGNKRKQQPRMPDVHLLGQARGSKNYDLRNELELVDGRAAKRGRVGDGGADDDAGLTVFQKHQRELAKTWGFEARPEDVYRGMDSGSNANAASGAGASSGAAIKTSTAVRMIDGDGARTQAVSASTTQSGTAAGVDDDLLGIDANSSKASTGGASTFPAGGHDTQPQTQSATAAGSTDGGGGQNDEEAPPSAVVYRVVSTESDLDSFVSLFHYQLTCGEVAPQIAVKVHHKQRFIAAGGTHAAIKGMGNELATALAPQLGVLQRNQVTMISVATDKEVVLVDIVAMRKRCRTGTSARTDAAAEHSAQNSGTEHEAEFDDANFDTSGNLDDDTSILKPLLPLLLDAAVTKVFWEGSEDIAWLQSSFGAHVVNVFDGYTALDELMLAGLYAASPTSEPGAGSDGSGAGAAAGDASKAGPTAASSKAKSVRAGMFKCTTSQAESHPNASAALVEFATKMRDFSYAAEELSSPVASSWSLQASDMSGIDVSARPLKPRVMHRWAEDIAALLPIADACFTSLLAVTRCGGALRGEVTVADTRDRLMNVPAMSAALQGLVMALAAVRAPCLGFSIARSGATTLSQQSLKRVSDSDAVQEALTAGYAASSSQAPPKGCTTIDRAILRSNLSVLRSPPFDYFHSGPSSVPLATPPWYLSCRLCGLPGHFSGDPSCTGRTDHGLYGRQAASEW